nr:transglycosylase SLT domain-containing protein [Anaerolineae bacterium]
MSNKPERYKRKKPTQPAKRAWFGSRSFWLELLFFIALATFAFSAVVRLLGGKEGGVVSFVPGSQALSKEAEIRYVLYEAQSRRSRPAPSLSPVFSPSVQYWESDILRWSEEHALDPNLVATLMQIESCGNPDAESWVGATGLFQVMPFHFEEGEDPWDPDTNALRGLNFIRGGLELSEGHAGLAMAGYNGGYTIISRDYEDWPYETQRYYRWGSGIYREASAGWDSSPTLEAWLSAGGYSLCEEARSVLELDR